jgi:hypothetical protein
MITAPGSGQGKSMVTAALARLHRNAGRKVRVFKHGPDYLDQQQLARTLNLPEHVYPLAYLCLGYVSEFLDQPELQEKGWRSRLPLEELVHGNGWGAPADNQELMSKLTDRTGQRR